MTKYTLRLSLKIGVILGLLFSFLPTETIYANVVGTDTQNFNPITSGLDFVTVQSSETLEPGVINFGLFGNYAVNSLPYFSGTANQTRANLNDTVTFADFNLGIGLAENWDAGVSFPTVISQTVQSSGNFGDFAKPGVTEIRINTKYRLTGDNSHGFALVGSTNLNQIEDNPFVGQDPGPTFNLEAALDQTFGKWAAGINVGYRWRQPGTPLPGNPISPFRNQYIASAATSVLISSWDTKLIFELFGSYPAQDVQFQSDRSQSSLEFLSGIKHDLTQNLALHAGLGTEVLNGTASPDWRAYAGLNWTMGPLWGHGIKNGSPEPPTIVRADNLDIPFDAKTESHEEFRATGLLFEFNSDELRPESKEALDRLAIHAMKPPEFKHMVIEGHTDSIGSHAYNSELSQRRASKVRNYLVEVCKLDSKRIEAIGYGPDKPIADNGNWQGRKKNRRVEFHVDRD